VPDNFEKGYSISLNSAEYGSSNMEVYVASSGRGSWPL
jgi:hypothetical protein